MRPPNVQPPTEPFPEPAKVANAGHCGVAGAEPERRNICGLSPGTYAMISTLLVVLAAVFAHALTVSTLRRHSLSQAKRELDKLDSISIDKEKNAFFRFLKQSCEIMAWTETHKIGLLLVSMLLILGFSLDAVKACDELECSRRCRSINARWGICVHGSCVCGYSEPAAQPSFLPPYIGMPG
ncbi:hypothetical protein HPB51_023068 [Rhipicephalus microplus]|uniref:Uncharacterized protein n=1 Tax=Rhipicephalus microplus TaxID=6941 RepID=A0A9J6ECM4_RHIMP|nr:hypothetical protein HPB51_023068 [Rhipicephalus microplus]